MATPFDRYLCCPVCDQSLTAVRRSLVCGNGHTFDVAREGYVNLLPALGSSKDRHGDTPAMLQARRSFLAQGHYRFLADALTDMLTGELHPSGTETRATGILDVGCGEGHYLLHLKRQLTARSGRADLQFFGLDLAKEAARMTAREDSQVGVVVGNTMVRLPFVSGSMCVVTNLFAPRNVCEFARVLDDRGVLMLVIPAPEHLGELRALIPLLPIGADKETNVIGQLSGAFDLEARQVVEQRLRLDHQAVGALINMTPNAWFVPEAQKFPLSVAGALEVTARFIILRFRKSAQADRGVPR